MWTLLKKHPKPLSFGLLVSIFTVIGQSYFLAFFNAPIRQALDLSRTEISGVYSAATLLTVFLLPRLGGWVDRRHPWSLLLAVCFGLALGLLCLASATHLVMVFAGYFLVRTLGQMTLGLIPSILISRSFGRHRGKALGLMSMGKFVGDGILPALAVLFLAWFSWRGALVATAAFMLLAVLPLSRWLLRDHRDTEFYEDKMNRSKYAENPFKTKDFFFDLPSMSVVLAGMILPFIMTAVFFQQETLLALKGWDQALFSRAFTAYSLIQVITNMAVGHLIDRFRAIRLLPVALVFFMAGLGALWVIPHSWGAYVFMGLIGVAVGAGSVVRMSFWAEVYGPLALGKVRGLDSTAVVFATSLAPLLSAWFLDAGFSMITLIQISLGLGAAGTLLYFLMSVYFIRHVEGTNKCCK